MSNHCIELPNQTMRYQTIPCHAKTILYHHAMPYQVNAIPSQVNVKPLHCTTRSCDARHTKSYYTSCQTILYCEYYAKPYPVMPYHTLKWQTILVPFCAKPYRTMLFKTMLCHAHTMSCHSVPYYVKPYRYHVMQNYFLTCSTQLCYWQTKQNHVN